MQIYFIHIFVIIYEVKDIYIIKNNLNKKEYEFNKKIRLNIGYYTYIYNH